MLTFERRKMNILRESRVIGNKEYQNDELLEIARVAQKHGYMTSLDVIALKGRLNRGDELTPMPGYSSRNFDGMIKKALTDPDVRAEMLTKRDSEVSGVRNDRSV